MRRFLTGQIFKNQNGFSIIEMTVYMGILAIMLGVLSTIFASTVNLQLSAESTTSVDQTGQYLLMRLTYDIHNTDTIVSPNTLGTPTNSLSINTSSTTYTYALNGTNLILSDGTNTFQLNNADTKITNFSVTRLGDVSSHKNSLQISFTVTSEAKSSTGYETQNYETTIGTR
jgi:type II secretory pathway pseudopilin PulG